MTGGGGLIALVSSFYSLSVSIFNSDWSVPSLLSIFSLSVYEQLSRSLFFQSFTAPSSLYHLSTQIYETAMHAFQHLSLLDTIASLVRRFIAMFYTSEYRMLGALLTPALVVVGTEVVVDGLKHAFITKFNQIKPESYTQFRATLMRDLAGKRQWVKRQKASTSSTSSSFTSTTSTTTTNIRASPLPPPPASTSSALDFTTNTTNTTENTTPHVPLHPATPSYSELRLSDRSHTVARRIGFLSLPLACVAVRNLTQTFEVLDLQIFPWKAVLASGGGSGGVRGGSNADIMHWIMGTHYTLAMQVWRLARRILLHSISHSIENSNTHNNTDDLNIFLQGISQLVRDYGIWARVFKVVGLAAFTALIILSVYGILLVVKVSIGIYLHKSALHFLAASEADQERQFQQQQQQQQHIQQQGHSKQVPFTSSAATTTLSSSMCDLKGSSEQSLEEKKLDQIDRYTFIKRII